MLSLGRKEQASQAFIIARNYLGQVFDDHESFNVACTYNYLAYYLASDGDDELAQNYVNIVDNYFERRQRRISMGQACFQSDVYIIENLEKAKGVTKLFFFDDRVVWDGKRKFTEAIAIALRLAGHSSVLPDFVNVLDTDLNTHTYPDHEQALLQVHEILKEHHKNTSVPDYPPIALLLDFLNYTYHKLEFLRVVLNKCYTNEERRMFRYQLIKEANTITEITENSLFYSFTPSFIYAFALAALVHYQSYFSEDIMQDLSMKASLLMYLEKDLRALRYYGEKYNRTYSCYGHIISSVRDLLDRVIVSPPEEMSSPQSTSSFEGTIAKRQPPSSQFLSRTWQNFMESKNALSSSLK